ncbi:unnamed protein product [Porites lobata]|uniref:Uncharacterized protein n=1 Tax=Porites lobata TaxID=104759 RepID=A0ABN8N4H3_9CNID|nr:unnamed protein product [Porites lobata]
MGEYRLAEEFKEKAVSPSQWSQMTTEQRKEYTKKVLHMKPENLGPNVTWTIYRVLLSRISGPERISFWRGTTSFNSKTPLSV